MSAQHCRAFGPGLEAAEAGVQAEFAIEACDALGNAADGSASDFEVVGGSAVETVRGTVRAAEGKGRFQAVYTANEPGNLKIMIRYKGLAIARCPYPVSVSGVNARDCKAEGNGLKFAVAGEDSQFRVLSFDRSGKPRSIASYESNLRTMIEYTSDASTKLAARISEVQAGAYGVSYCGKVAGEIRISVTVRDEHIPGSPFLAQVMAGTIDGGACRAYGPGLQSAVLAQPASFTVEVRDANGNLRTAGGDAVEVSVKAPRGSIPAQVEDKRNGMYTVQYSAMTEGTLQISVSVDRQAVKGSPFSVDVAGVDAQSCSASGEGLQHAIAGVEAGFRVMCRSKDGELIELPDGGQELSIKFVEQGKEQAGTHAPSSKGLFDAAYTPGVAGMCSVLVMYKGQHIRGSPFSVMVEAGELCNVDREGEGGGQA